MTRFHKKKPKKFPPTGSAEYDKPANFNVDSEKRAYYDRLKLERNTYPKVRLRLKTHKKCALKHLKKRELF